MKLSLSFAKIVCFLLFCVLAGCAKPENANQQTAVYFGSGLTQEFPSPIKETLVPEESTPLPASTSLPFPYLFKECTTLSNEDESDVSDRLVLWSIKDDKPVFIDANGSAFVSDQNIQRVSIIVSPNGSKMAYIQESPRKIVIVSSLGETIRSVNIPENWVWPISWVSDRSIFFEKRDNFGESRFEPGKIIAFDIETGQFLELYPDFPDIVPWVEGYPNWAGNMTFLPNPMLDFTIYSVAGGGISLWNLDSKTEVKRIYDYVNINSDPVWSQTGKWFIVNIPLAVEENEEKYINWEDDYPYVAGHDLFVVRHLVNSIR